MFQSKIQLTSAQSSSFQNAPFYSFVFPQPNLKQPLLKMSHPLRELFSNLKLDSVK